MKRNVLLLPLLIFLLIAAALLWRWRATLKGMTRRPSSRR